MQLGGIGTVVRPVPLCRLSDRGLTSLPRSRTREQQELEESKLEVARLTRINAFLQRRLEDLLQTTPKRPLSSVDCTQLPSPPYEHADQSTAYIYSPDGHTHGSPQNVTPDDLCKSLFPPRALSDSPISYHPWQDPYLTPNLSPRFQVQSLAHFVTNSSGRTLGGDGEVIIGEQWEEGSQAGTDVVYRTQEESVVEAVCWPWS